MKLKRTLLITLLLSFIISMMSGCVKSAPGNTPGSPDVSAPGTNNTVKGQTEQRETGTGEQGTAQNPISEPYIEDVVFREVPMDLGGREIKFLSAFPNRWRKNPNENAITPNEVLEVVEALEQIEKDYNCKITVEEIKGRNLLEQALAAKAAGDTLGDILEMDITGSYMESLYSEGIVMDMTNDPIIDLGGNPWLPQTQFANMFGKQFGVHFLAKGSGDVLRGVLVYNKTMAEKYGLPDIYELVRRKEWTFDKFREVCEIIYSKAGGQVYPIGYSHEGIFIPLFVFANNGTYVDNTPEGYKYNALQENTLEANNFVVELIKAGYVMPERGTDEMFMDGKYVFYFGNYSAQAKYKANMSDEYGLLPVPLGPKASQYCAVTYNDSIFHIFNNIEKPEQVAAVLVAIANRCSKKNIIHDEMMTVLSNMESAEVFEILYRNVKCDLSRVVSTVRSIFKDANNKILAREVTPAEILESIGSEVQSLLDQVIYKGE